jgi:hypothetical protein
MPMCTCPEWHTTNVVCRINTQAHTEDRILYRATHAPRTQGSQAVEKERHGIGRRGTEGMGR